MNKTSDHSVVRIPSSCTALSEIKHQFATSFVCAVIRWLLRRFVTVSVAYLNLAHACRASLNYCEPHFLFSSYDTYFEQPGQGETHHSIYYPWIPYQQGILCALWKTICRMGQGQDRDRVNFVVPDIAY